MRLIYTSSAERQCPSESNPLASLYHATTSLFARADDDFVGAIEHCEQFKVLKEDYLRFIKPLPWCVQQLEDADTFLEHAIGLIHTAQVGQYRDFIHGMLFVRNFLNFCPDSAIVNFGAPMKKILPMFFLRWLDFLPPDASLASLIEQHLISKALGPPPINDTMQQVCLCNAVIDMLDSRAIFKF